MEWKEFYRQRYDEEVFLRIKDLSNIGEEKEFIDIIEYYLMYGESIEPLLQRAMDLNAQFSYKVFLSVIEGFKYEKFSISNKILIKTAQSYLNPKNEAECIEILHALEEIAYYIDEVKNWFYKIGEILLNRIKDREILISFKFIGGIFPFIKNREECLELLQPLANAKAEENVKEKIEDWVSEGTRKAFLRALANKNAEEEIKAAIIDLEMQYEGLGEDFLQCLMGCGRKFSFEFINDVRFHIEEDVGKILVQHNATTYTMDQIKQLADLMPGPDDYVDAEWEREIDEVEDAYWEEEARKDFERDQMEEDILISLLHLKTRIDNSHCLYDNIFVVFDIETTGLNCNSEKVDKIIEIGAVKIKNGEIQDTFSTFVACDEPLSPTIIEITGIKDGDLVGAPKIEQAIMDFYAFVEGAYLVAHNIRFDYKFIQFYGLKNGYSFTQKHIDTVTLAKQILSDKVPNYKLNTIANYYNFNFQHHRAFNDAEVTAKIFLQLLKENNAPSIIDFANIYCNYGKELKEVEQLVSIHSSLDAVNDDDIQTQNHAGGSVDIKQQIETYKTGSILKDDFESIRPNIKWKLKKIWHRIITFFRDLYG